MGLWRFPTQGMVKSPVKHKDPITGFALPAIRGNAYERFRPLPVVGFLFKKHIADKAGKKYE